MVGYTTADQYNLLLLSEHLHRQGLYQVQPLVDELAATCVYAKANYDLAHDDAGGKASPSSRSVFFFENGSCVFWNMPELERDTLLAFVRACESGESYPEDTVHAESEMMEHRPTEGPSKVRPDGTIALATSAAGETDPLERYALSNGIAASVKLGALETALDRIIDSTEHISGDLKQGVTLGMSRDEVLRKTGEIFALRHVLNLSSDLRDTPDFYWDRDALEKLYLATTQHLSLAKRTRVMNEKLTHCSELMSLVSEHLSDKHHVRLEWFIIVLIMIEVVFELAHFVERLL